MSDEGGPRIIARGKGRSDDRFLRVRYRTGGRSRVAVVSVSEHGMQAASVRLNILTPGSKLAFARDSEDALRNMRPTFSVADRAGFAGDSYIWPDGEWVGDEVPSCLTYPAPPRYGVRGRLRDWQEIPRSAVGNPRMMLALAHSLSGPVVELLGCEASAIQLVGEAGVLKSSMAAIIASVWGIELKSWNRTTNSDEALALNHDATFLVLDDFRPQKGLSYADLQAAAIRLGDGRMKGRHGEIDRTFSVPILSNANNTLDELAAAARLPDDANQAAARGRLIDIPLASNRAVLFENLHGFETPLDFVKHLARVASENTGVASVAFVEGMLRLRRLDAPALREWLLARQDYYVAKARSSFPDLPGYELTRVHAKMGMIYATGRLGIRLRIFAWRPEELFDAIFACEAAHVALRSNDAPERPGAAVSPMVALRRHVAEHAEAFVDLRRGLIDPHGRHDHQSCKGYFNSGADGLEVLFPVATLMRVCGGRVGLRAVQRELARCGALLPEGKRPTARRFIFDDHDRNARSIVVAIRADIFAQTRDGGS